VAAQRIAVCIKAGGHMLVIAFDGDAAGIGTAHMGAGSGGFVAAVGGVTGMMLTQTVFFGGKSSEPQGCGQRKRQDQRSTPSEKGFAHGFGFLLE
jgi:hypothetical protein